MSETDLSRYGIKEVIDVTEEYKQLQKDNEELEQKLENIKEIAKYYSKSREYMIEDCLTDLVDDLYEVLGIEKIIEGE